MIRLTALASGLSAAMIICVAHPSIANENVVGRPKAGVSIGDQDASIAQVHDARFLTNPRMLSEQIRSTLGYTGFNDYALPAVAHDGKTHPFTTKNANSASDITPVDKFPWSATGKLVMKFGSNSFVCTASIIGKGILVTAAHCVHNYGKQTGGFADAVSFEPALHGTRKPFGTWVAKEWWIPKVYFDGTDTCSTEAPGIVCENDIAIIVMEQQSGRFVSEKAGQYGFKADDYGYGLLFGKVVAQITQLGYPSKNYDGTKMIRTDSLGYQDAPSNVVIGSAQTGGSSGGPWLMNFGLKTSYNGTPPRADDDNQVIGTTSWGFNSGGIMIQGASRFGKNRIYTSKSNIQSLWDSACGANPSSC